MEYYIWQIQNKFSNNKKKKNIGFVRGSPMVSLVETLVHVGTNGIANGTIGGNVGTNGITNVTICRTLNDIGLPLVLLVKP